MSVVSQLDHSSADNLDSSQVRAAQGFVSLTILFLAIFLPVRHIAQKAADLVGSDAHTNIEKHSAKRHRTAPTTPWRWHICPRTAEA